MQQIPEIMPLPVPGVHKIFQDQLQNLKQHKKTAMWDHLVYLFFFLLFYFFNNFLHTLPPTVKHPPWRELLGPAMVGSFPVIKQVYEQTNKWYHTWRKVNGSFRNTRWQCNTYSNLMRAITRSYILTLLPEQLNPNIQSYPVHSHREYPRL